MNKNLYIENKDFQQISSTEIRKKLKINTPLETFKFQEEVASAEHWITISSPEFTAICPFSNYPDFGEVTIKYVPHQKCLELKSFKLYINAFRDIKIFHETVTEIILADFIEKITPKKAIIIVNMNVRGNIKTICEKFYNTPSN